ncbi:Ammonium transporter [Mycena venus]|uniref:Ammonium transporter n=1 Tax=Mycena venus TaxID=2733690 RepID=A0A8H6XJ39_9AGAR|nr:Ammonium transporter [Mycena venus]
MAHFLCILWTILRVFASMALVGFFYSGLLRLKNALSMIYLSMMTVAVVSFQWFFRCFSLSETGSTFIGNLKAFTLSAPRLRLCCLLLLALRRRRLCLPSFVAETQSLNKDTEVVALLPRGTRQSVAE